ncbi:MAG TPA: tetratricopeptide repeat protein [Thermoanaerobaculia bacterium]|nr:tetratricopeptide repeat protein [Thermoanaerobaculia bacterium]
MRKITLLLLFSCGLAAGACGRLPLEDQIHREWRGVLELKSRIAEAPAGGEAEARQRHADALTGFIQRHPSHARARDAYGELELEFARMLAARGRYDEAVRYYRSALDSDPANETIHAELEQAERRRFVTADALSLLRPGMTREQVVERLGRPLPGWSRRLDRNSKTTESWFYRRRDGGVAGVYFRDGALFAADFDGPVRLDLQRGP